ncbi:MAG: mechanosensitive ion channel family protein [Nitrososphaerota archaeon]|nr:mechanosensitive ion channel family protein [Nitrososphaerota archaeon]
MVFEIFSDSTTINLFGSQVSVTSLLVGIIIMVVGVVAARIIGTLFKKYFAANLPGNVAANLYKLIYYGIIIIALLAVITSQGIDLSGLMVAGGIFGIVIGFAAQSVVSNLFSGIFLMFDRPAKTGDLIEIPQSNTYGKLMDITIFSTRIKLFDGSIMRVPNEKIFTSEIRNVSGSEVRRLEVALGIAYKEDIDHTISVIKKAVSKLAYVLSEPKPEVWTEQLADSSINLKVLAWIPRDEWDNVGPILLKEIKKEIDEAGIEIPFPQRVIHYADKTKSFEATK